MNVKFRDYRWLDAYYPFSGSGEKVDTWQVRLNWAVPVVGLLQNVLHFDTEINAYPTYKQTAEALANGFRATINPVWMEMVPSECVQTSISVRRVSAPGGPTYTIITGVYGKANTMGDSAIAFDIALMPKDPPWEPGHIYVAPVEAALIADNIWQPPAIARAQAICNILKDPLNGSPVGGTSFQQTVWSRKTKTSRIIAEWLIRPKPTALNKRLAPFP